MAARFGAASGRRVREWRTAFRKWNADEGEDLRQRARDTSEKVIERTRQRTGELKEEAQVRIEQARPHVEKAARETRERAAQTWDEGKRRGKLAASLIASTMLFGGIVMLVLYLASATNADRTDIRCTGCESVDVIQIIDGDTLDTSFGRIRIYGADTPERDELCFAEATEEMRRLAGEEIRVERGPRMVDSFDRNLYYAYTKDGNSIDELLIRNGFAVAWTADGQHRDLLVATQQTAELDNVGCLWN